MKGRGKGSEFERTLCKKLSLWWTHGQRDDVFWRTSISGGRATFRSRKGKKTHDAGDITAVDAIGQPLTDLVAIEAKNGYPGVSCMDLLDSPGISIWERWLVQAWSSHSCSDSFGWMLVTKKNRRSEMVFLDGLVYAYLVEAAGTELPLPKLSILCSISVLPFLRIVGCPLDNFLETFTPETVRKAKDSLVKRRSGS